MCNLAGPQELIQLSLIIYRTYAVQCIEDQNVQLAGPQELIQLSLIIYRTYAVQCIEDQNVQFGRPTRTDRAVPNNIPDICNTVY
jgi:hypothetical protein